MYLTRQNEVFIGLNAANSEQRQFVKEKKSKIFQKLQKYKHTPDQISVLFGLLRLITFTL